MGREGRDYWEAQLSEYWDSGLTIQEYRQLTLSYESSDVGFESCIKNRKCINSHIAFATGYPLLYIN